LIRKPLPKDIEEFEKGLSGFEVSTCRFLERTKRSPKLANVIEDKLPPHLLASLPHSIDFIGDIAIVEIPPDLEVHREVVGEAILKTHKRVHTVLAKSGAVKGVYRLRELKTIAGIGKTETVHREHGCLFHVDPTKAYFSPRLSHEHDRVASQIRNDETIIDMFAGVGPFSILIAKRHEGAKVYAVDVNPDAVGYLKKNIEANHVGEIVTPFLGDIRQIVKKEMLGIADRVIMNLPESAIEYVDVACQALKPEGGVVHYYEFASMPEPLKAAKVRLIEAMKQTGCSIRKILCTRLVRATAPYTFHVVVDAETQ
jgi:tRNA (guanine37-N1)-methyltransferase